MTYFLERGPELLMRFVQHVELVGAGVFVAVAVGFGSGLALHGRTRLQPLLLGLVNIVQTIPALALLAFLLPVTGIGWKPAVVALSLYGIMPILRNTLTVLGEEHRGLAGVARALGLTPWQVVWWVQIPQGLPLLVSGLRSAVVWSVGTATLGAYIGAGGLGEFITRGITLQRTSDLLMGAIPVALLALGLDALLGRLEKDCAFWREGNRFPTLKWRCMGGLFFASVIVLAVSQRDAGPYKSETASKMVPLHIGTKNFGEQFVLGELIAQYLEAKGFPVARPLTGFQSTELVDGALQSGDIDLYVEYLGTAEHAILKLPDSSAVDPMQAVREAYEKRDHIAWLKSLGFSNTYALILRSDSARRAAKLSDLIPLAAQLHLGLNSEFIERPDGFPALEKAYGMHFGRVDTLDVGLLYPALQEGRVDGIVGFSTDGRLAQPGLVVLADDRSVFPRYDAVPAVRDDTLASHPGLKEALEALAGQFNEETMRHLNAEIELQNKEPAAIARAYWKEHGLGK